MSIELQVPSCLKASYANGQIHVSYSDGREVEFPVSANGRLRGQSDASLSNIEIGHFGLHWPDLDEDLSHAGLRAGRFGQP